MGRYIDLSIASNMHIEDCVENTGDKVLAIDSNTVAIVPIFIGPAMLVNLMAETEVGVTNNVTTTESDSDRHQVVLLTFNRNTRSDHIVEQFDSFSYPHISTAITVRLCVLLSCASCA